MKPTGRIRSASAADWTIFLHLAAAEGWRVPAQEIEFFQGPMADGVFVLECDNAWCGFVTAASHGASGWIGNLLVPPERRHAGWGGQLFDHAVAHLQGQGVKTLWLTASESGRPLYLKRGFLTVGGVTRWQRQGGGECGAVRVSDSGSADWADALVWGEPRRRLLDFLGARGSWLSTGTTAALLQHGETLQILGPWVSLSGWRGEAGLILEQACRHVGPGAELLIDILDGSTLADLPREQGFLPVGHNLLMARGPVDPAGLRRLVALASLGSFG